MGLPAYGVKDAMPRGKRDLENELAMTIGRDYAIVLVDKLATSLEKQNIDIKPPPLSSGVTAEDLRGGCEDVYKAELEKLRLVGAKLRTGQ